MIPNPRNEVARARRFDGGVTAFAGTIASSTLKAQNFMVGHRRSHREIDPEGDMSAYSDVHLGLESTLIRR